MGALPMPFCPGRIDVDATVAAEQSKNLDPEIYLDPQTATADALRESMKIMGFTDREMVVLNGGGHAIGQCHHFRSGFHGPWTNNPAQLDNEFFNLLLNEDWEVQTVHQTNKKQFQSGALMMLFSDMVFRDDDQFRAIVEEYAQDNDLFLEDFRNAWIKLVNADRFGGVCVMADDSDEMDSSKTPEMPFDKDMEIAEPYEVICEDRTDTSTIVWVCLIILILIIVAQFAFMYLTTRKTLDKQTKSVEMPELGLGGSIIDVESK